MAKEHFISSIKSGNQGEQLLQDLFELHGYECQKSPGKFSEYDFTIRKREKEFTIEVKSDFMATQTGNVAIEYFNPKSNKASGITVTESDYWVHILFNPVRILIARTRSLYHFVSSVKPLKLINRGGDGNASLMIYPIDVIQDAFIDITDVNDLESTMKEL
jgi:hypothetical protein